MESHRKHRYSSTGLIKYTATNFGLLATCILSIQAAQGDIVTVEVAGTVDEIFYREQGNFDLDGSVSIGTPYLMTLVIDTDAPDLQPGSVGGEYAAVSLSGQFGNYAWVTTPSSVPEIEIENDVGGASDGYSADQLNAEFTGSLVVGGTLTPFESVLFENLLTGFFMTDETMTAIDSDALVIPDIGDWDNSGFTVSLVLDDFLPGVNDNDTIIVRGTVDSIITVPEPGVATMAGLLITAFMTKRR